MHTHVSTWIASILPVGSFPVRLTQAFPRPILRVWRGWGSGQARPQIFKREETKVWVWKVEEKTARRMRPDSAAGLSKLQVAGRKWLLG